MVVGKIVQPIQITSRYVRAWNNVIGGMVSVVSYNVLILNQILVIGYLTTPKINLSVALNMMDNVNKPR